MAANDPTQSGGQAPTIDRSTGHAQEIEAQAIAQAVRDPAFRTRLLAEPRAVFAEMGLHIPPEIQIQALEENADHYYLVLPALEWSAGRTGTGLSDIQLEAVAGGADHPLDSQDSAWTGCASGQSGCAATIGCSAF